MALRTVFGNHLAGFNAAAGTPPVAIDFDSIAINTEIAGSTIKGVTFSSPPGNTLPLVVRTSAFTPGGFGSLGDTGNKLVATSGANVVPPGGISLVPSPSLAESDGFRFDFATPVSAFGLDVLFQSIELSVDVSFELRDAANQPLAHGAIDTFTAPVSNGSDQTTSAPEAARGS